MKADDLTAAACRGKWHLFDSVDLADHVAAAAVCATCPALIACMGQALDLRAEGRPMEGTWAGLLHGKQGVSRIDVNEVAQARRRRAAAADSAQLGRSA